jgi:predicted N-acetyltransferase YhbS
MSSSRKASNHQYTQEDGMYSFEKAQHHQSDALFSLYREATIQGNKNGTSDWSEKYPTREFLDEDIEVQRIFVRRGGDKIIASVSLLETDDLDHKPIGWRDLKSCVPVRLCVSPTHQGQRIGEQVMNCLIEHVKLQVMLHIGSILLWL